MTFYKFGCASIQPDTRDCSQSSSFMPQPDAMNLSSAVSSSSTHSITHSIELSIIANFVLVACGLSILSTVCVIASLIILA